MSSIKYTPYTYLIGWSKMNMWYYGAEYAKIIKIANPSNLWNTYFTSSTQVAWMREFYGEPDIIQVRKIFQNANDTLKWECNFLHKVKAKNSKNWLNENDGNFNFYTCESAPKRSEKTKKKTSISTTLYWASKEGYEKRERLSARNAARFESQESRKIQSIKIRESKSKPIIISTGEVFLSIPHAKEVYPQLDWYHHFKNLDQPFERSFLKVCDIFGILPSQENQIKTRRELGFDFL